jgi:hypothetical protein
MLTREEIEKRYPGAVEAVLWHEHPTLKEAIWGTIAGEGNVLSPEVLLAIFKQIGGQPIEYVPDRPMKNFIHQLDHPDFMRYIRDKLAGRLKESVRD